MPLGMLPLLGFLATPLTALAVAAGAVALPVIIHLLNRRRYRIVPWAAMRFLIAAERQNTRRMRLEHILLLAVRCSIVLLLVLAMASVMPWSEELWFRLFPSRAAQAARGSRRTHKILVLDGSFSMATRVGDTNFFERARSTVAQILRESQSGDGFSVVLMAAPPRRIVPEPSEDAGKVNEEIQGLHLPHGNADLPATLTAVEDMLRQSPDKFDEREVYFITDLQRSTWAARQNADTASLLLRIQARSRTIFLDVGQEGINNSAVINLALGVPFITTGEATPITATVHHYAAESRQHVRAELLVGRARAAASDPAFEFHGVGQQFVDLAPGQNIVSFSHKFTAPGDYAIQVRLEGDALELDDSRTVVVTAKDNVPVMLVNGKPAAEVYDRATEWLADALNPFHKGLAPRDVSARPKIVTEAQFADAALGDLTPYDCVFLCDVPQLSAGEVHRLETHLRRGGGVVFCLGPQVDLEVYNRLLFHNGEGILPARFLSKQEAPAKRFFNFIAEEDAYHEPPLAAFAGERDRASLLAARFRQYIRVELAPRGGPRKVLAFMPEAISDRAGAIPGDRGPAAAGGTALPVGDPALVEWSRYRGRVALFTSTVNMDWTTWPISPSFPALTQELLHFAVAGRLREQAAVVGDVLEEYLLPGEAGLEVNMRTTDGRTESARTELRGEVGVLRWSDTDLSGVYRATLGQYPREHLFAVNVPTSGAGQQSSESDLARTNQTELQTAYPGWDFQLVSDPRQVVHSVGPLQEASAERPIHGMGAVIARWLLLLMVVLLVAEVIMAWRFGHYTAVPGESSQQAKRSGRDLLLLLFPGLLFPVLLVLAFVLIHAAWTGDFMGFLPESARRGIEARLGVPPPAAGEGTRWHLEFNPYLWDAAADPWLAGAFALGVGILVGILYAREGKTAGKGYKALLAVLRICLLLVALAVLLPQVQLRFERQGWPDLAILIDDSRSMSTADHYQNPEIREAAARLGQQTSLPLPERLQLAQALLTHHNHDWLLTLLENRRFKVHVYHCSSRASRLVDITEPRQMDAAVEVVLGLRAEGEESQLGTVVRQVINDFRGSSLAAVVMLTDGVTTEGEDLVKVSRYASQVGVPLFFVGIGDAQDVRDLKLHDLQVEDAVYVNDRLVFEARLTAQGYTEPRTVLARLYEKDKDGKLKELAKQPVTTDPQGKPVQFRLMHRPTEPGERTYVVDVPEQEDEVKPATNNRLERTILVRDAKIVKVLYIEGYARYEYRFVKNLLERESARAARNKTIDLKVLLLDADNEYASEDKSAIADFPTKDELNGYDVILFGDVDPKDKKVGPQNLQHLADFVKERGGGLLMIAGTRWSPHAFKDSPLADVLPVQVIAPPPQETEYLTGYRPERTSIGRFHPIFRFSPDETENTAIWNHLAEVFWYSEGYRIQPAAEVLLVHPQPPAAALASHTGAGEGGHPLLVQQFVGAGRSMFLGLDETWRWRYREDELRFNQFWIQTIRYLARSRLGRVELRVDRQTPYRRGEPIKVTVRFPDDAPPPGPDTKVEVIVTRTLPVRDAAKGEIEKETLSLAKMPGSRATYEGLLTRTPEGEYRFWLSAPVVAGSNPRAEARVLPPAGEMERLRMNQSDMERAAEETHGRFYTIANAERLLDELPSGTRVAFDTPQPPQLLWNHFAMFALVLTLLGSEWGLRKRKHLL
ncbi:MAG TPA: VWA domain-containing protein [Gemmataceae bacterium]|nr:VWA domain-containing protein [Gemmataceae bacterium]